MRTGVVPCGRVAWGGSSAAVAGDPSADGGPDRLGRFLGHGAGQAVEVLDGLAGDVAVGVRGLQVAAQQIWGEVLALQVGGEGADQEMVVGEGAGQGVQDQALPLPHVIAVQGLQVLGAGEVGVDAAAVVGHQGQQLRWHALARRARGGLDCGGFGFYGPATRSSTNSRGTR